MFNSSDIKNINLIAILLFSLIFQHCTTKSSTEATDTVVTMSAKPEPETAPEKIDGEKLLSSILLLPNGAERFSKINENVQELPILEAKAASDSTANSYTFSHYFTSMEDEFLDAIYYYENDKVHAIALDVYLNTAADVQNLLAAAEIHFNKKFGKSKSKDQKKVWTINKSFEVSLADVSEKLAPGLKITFNAIGNKIPVE